MVCQREANLPVTTVPGDVTRMLRRLDEGDREAVACLLPLVYDELRTLAARRLAREPAGHSLVPTALVHEAWLRLTGKAQPHWNDRQHFFRAAAMVMRCILVDRARARKRRRRSEVTQTGAGQHSNRLIVAFEERALDLLALDEALQKLETVDPRQADLIELRFFAGLSNKEAAEMLGVSPRTASIDWSLARAWLQREMNGESHPPAEAAGERDLG